MSDQYEQRDNSGVLFENDKRKNPKAPVMQGEVVVDGTKKRIVVWPAKYSRNGKRYWSVSFNDPEPQMPREEYLKPRPEDLPPIDDEVPY